MKLSKFHRFIALALLSIAVGCAPEVTPVQQPQSTATTSNTTREVCDITAELLGVNASDVKPATSLAVLAADELDAVELVMELEEHFDVSIPDDAITDVAGNDDWQAGIAQLTNQPLFNVVTFVHGGDGHSVSRSKSWPNSRTEFIASSQRWAETIHDL